MPRRGRSEKSVRSATGRKRARLRSSRRGQAPANKGAHCIARQRVYSRVLRRNVTRCRKFAGGRVGIRKPDQRKPYGPRCTRFKRVYSPVFRKQVRRCAKYRWPDTTPPAPTRLPEPASLFPVNTPLFSAVFSPPAAPLLLLPPDAKSLRNREMEAAREELRKLKMYRRLRGQMSRLKSRTQSQVTSRWPLDRPKGSR